VNGQKQEKMKAAACINCSSSFEARSTEIFATIFIRLWTARPARRGLDETSSRFFPVGSCGSLDHRLEGAQGVRRVPLQIGAQALEAGAAYRVDVPCAVPVADHELGREQHRQVLRYRRTGSCAASAPTAWGSSTSSSKSRRRVGSPSATQGSLL
jgi:hypothetical protein